jgi:SAM-dependent methyltransferase
VTSEPPFIPHDVPGSRIPDVRELAGLFPPLSAGRARLHRAHRILEKFQPAAPPYVYWHLARYVHTLGGLVGVVRPGSRWLDISSDPWFCLLARKELGLADELVATGYDPGAIDFHDGNGERYPFVAQQLRLSADDTTFPTGDELDVVSAFEVIEHLQFHPAPFLAACSNALRAGGRLVLTTPNVASWSTIKRLFNGAKPHMTGQYGGPMDHRKEYTTWELQRVLEAAGFRVDRLSTFDGYPNDRKGLRDGALWLGTLAWHAASLRPVRVRNQLLRGGSTMMIVATKRAPCDPREVAAVAV